VPRKAVRLGVAGAAPAFLVLAAVQAAAIRAYLPPDELYHVGYAATLLDGRLPTLDSRLPADRVPLPPDDGRSRRIYVANHPPLFYAISALPIGLGQRFGAPRMGLVAARLLPVAAAGVLVTVLAGGPAIGFYLRNRSLYGSLTGAAYNQSCSASSRRTTCSTCWSRRPMRCGSTTASGPGPA